MDILTLKNGTEEPDVLVKTTTIALKNLVQNNPIAAYELVELCKNPNHELFGNSKDILEKSGLVNNGTVHESIKNIVLSSFEGEGFDMQLVWPVKPKE